MSSENSETKPTDSPTPSVNIKQLFDLKRVETLADILFICLYFPLGICLLLVRIFIFLYLLLISNFFPKSPLKRFLFLVLGIVVQEEELPTENKAKVFISNRVSDFDSIILNLINPCNFFGSLSVPQFVNWICDYSTVEESNQSSKSKFLSSMNEKTPVVCFPESSKTNGKVGLFKFEAWPFCCDQNIHLIFLETKRPYANVAISPLESSWGWDLFWLLFLPFTIFSIRYVGSVKRNENESPEEFSKRVQTQIASKMSLHSTNFNAHDKKEFIKRLNDELKLTKAKKSKPPAKKNNGPPGDFSVIEEMAKMVKDVLPQVPLAIIKEDVKVTKNIDTTIERILTGQVKYTPEPSPSKVKSSSESRAACNDSTDSSTLCFGAPTFGKTADERSKSFEQRKNHLFRVARMRYLKKYGLN